VLYAYVYHRVIGQHFAISEAEVCFLQVVMGNVFF